MEVIKHTYRDDFICSICLDSTHKISAKNYKIVTNCCHIFHRKCIKTWMMQPSYMNNCPVCRTNLLNYRKYL